MSDDLGKKVLKGVSRSFYLTLRLLPAPMRDGASLGYLLARSSDTIADTAAVPAEMRIALLEKFSVAVESASGISPWPTALLDGADPKEKLLLERTPELLEWLRRCGPEEARLVREVVRVIISGQTLDLQRFADASEAGPIALPDKQALDDYTWRVAGCVGEFWTKLGFLTLGERYSSEPEALLLEKGASYGKGLQLVNILRDLPRDLAAGRCYLPVSEPLDRRELMAAFHYWRKRAVAWTKEGETYATMLNSPRLRAASALPALIAGETLDLLENATWDSLQTRVKVPRSRIYPLLFLSFFQ